MKIIIDVYYQFYKMIEIFDICVKCMPLQFHPRIRKNMQITTFFKMHSIFSFEENTQAP